MAGTDLLLFLLKQSVTVLLVPLVLRALRRASAARRVFAARCGLAALLLTPLVWLFAPALPVHLPYAWSVPFDPPLALPKLSWLAEVPSGAAAFAAPARAIDLGRLLLLTYGACALLLALRIAVNLIRLGRIARDADSVPAPAWRDALARLRGQFGLRRPITLLVSSRVASPLSWGLRRPVILLDRHSIDHADPDAILAHELAHIASHDWPTLLLARGLLALYWWHPAMHLLVNTLEHDAECAADDAVLATGVPPSHYAQTLVSVSRHAFAPRPGSPLASHIAGRGALLVARIGALLELRRARGPVTPGQWLAGVGATGALLALLGGLVLRGEQVIWPERVFAPADKDTTAQAVQLLDALDNPNFRTLAAAMRAEDFSQRHAPGGASFRQRAAIPALILAMQDHRPVVRQLAVWGLGEMGFPETAPALAALLTDPSPDVRAEAVGALGDLGETRWLRPMLAMLLDGDARVRLRVAHALGDLREPASIPALRAALRDPDAEVAAEAQWALDELR